MTRTTSLLLERIQALPADEQERTAQHMLDELEELSRLRAQLQPALDSLDRDEGKPFDGEAIMRRFRERHGRA